VIDSGGSTIYGFLLVENIYVATPNERSLVGNAVIDTYVQRTPPVK